MSSVTSKPSITSYDPEATSRKKEPCCTSQKALIITALFILTVAAAAITFAVTASVAYALIAAAVTVLVFSAVAALACKRLFCSSREATPPLPPLRAYEKSQRSGVILHGITKDSVAGFTVKDFKKLILRTLMNRGETHHVSHSRLIHSGKIIPEEWSLEPYRKDDKEFEYFLKSVFITLAPLPEILDTEFQTAIKDGDLYCDEIYMNESAGKDLVEKAGKARTVLETNREKLHTRLKETTEDSELAEKAFDDARTKVAGKKLDELQALRNKANNHKKGIEDVIHVVEYQLERLPK